MLSEAQWDGLECWGDGSFFKWIVSFKRSRGRRGRLSWNFNRQRQMTSNWIFCLFWPTLTSLRNKSWTQPIEHFWTIAGLSIFSKRLLFRLFSGNVNWKNSTKWGKLRQSFLVLKLILESVFHFSIQHSSSCLCSCRSFSFSLSRRLQLFSHFPPPPEKSFLPKGNRENMKLIFCSLAGLLCHMCFEYTLMECV